MIIKYLFIFYLKSIMKKEVSKKNIKIDKNKIDSKLRISVKEYISEKLNEKSSVEAFKRLAKK